MIRWFSDHFKACFEGFWDRFVPIGNCVGGVFWTSVKVGFVEVPKMLGIVALYCCCVLLRLILYVPVFQKCQDDWNMVLAFVYAGLGGF